MPASSVIEEQGLRHPLPALNPPQIGDIGSSEPVTPPGHSWPWGKPAIPPASAPSGEPWTWQILPEGLIYKAYLAGGRESRLGTQWVHERHGDWMWDPTLGGRVGLVRYGSQSPAGPEGWQLDAEGAAFPRIRLDSEHTLLSTDFRFGFPLTWRRGMLESKLGYYHMSSHLGDEFMVSQHSLERLNYARDSLVWGIGVRPAASVRLYAEADWAFAIDGGSKPWHFQFGLDLSPAEPNRGIPYPFLAVNSRLREEVDFSGSLTVQAGLQWRSQTDRLLRLGLQYFNGLSDQSQFFRQFEEQIGFGVWCDF